MRAYYISLCPHARPRSRLFLIFFLTILNFVTGLYLITSSISVAEKPTDPLKPLVFQIDIPREEQIDVIKIRKLINPPPKRIQKSYENYFRIDYTIVHAQCKPIHMFNTTETLQSIENLTNYKLNEIISQNTKIHIHIIKINTIMKTNERIKTNSPYISSKLVCDYTLELYIGFNYPSYCGDVCRVKESQRLTAITRPFGSEMDSSFKFRMFSDSFEPSTEYNIQQFLIYRSSIYLDKSVYIRSLLQIRYASVLILDSDGYQTSVLMSQNDKSLFQIKDGLDPYTFENNGSSIYVSFLSLSAPNSYLRHESGRVKLAKNDQSNLFKQDATFRLVLNQQKKDSISFESTNLAQSYIAVDQDTKTALILTQPEQISITDNLDEKFLFTIIIEK